MPVVSDEPRPGPSSTGARVRQLELGALRGLTTFRWLAWSWMATVLVLARRSLERPVAAVLLVVAALAVTGWLTFLLRRRPEALTTARVVGVEAGVALALQLADGFVYRAPHVFTPEQPLGVAWPIAAVLAAGVAVGPAAGALTGVALGAARAVSAVANVDQAATVWLGPLTPPQVLSLVTTTVLYALAGGVAGYVLHLLRRAERRVAAAERRLADARARERVARRLHDGVLQTLALVERRTEDEQLAELAREQERDLRDFLFGTGTRATSATAVLGDGLRAAAGRFERVHGGRVEVLLPDDLPDLDAEVVEAVTGAVGEALTNAGRHGGARRVVVYAEPDDNGMVLSVRDDGSGFDPVARPEGTGLRGSVRGRISEVGGDVEVRSAPGRGTEIRLRVPASTGPRLAPDGGADEE